MTDPFSKKIKEIDNDLRRTNEILKVAARSKKRSTQFIESLRNQLQQIHHENTSNKYSDLNHSKKNGQR